MTDFGDVLRKCRQSCREHQNPRRPLSQGRLGELLGKELNMQGGGYSAAAISDWELGKSKISADQRLVLMSLIKILHELGGLRTSAEANNLLEAGYYRALNPDEKRRIFPQELHTTASEDPTYKSGSQQ
ncbi:MAG TPA: hypothetical protein VFQ23_08695, partial [Anaerolineales bacterium]|nr:hypothetical protein [Anaerolineales bacterium]